MKTEELKTTFQGCETALNIIADQIGDANGEATWYPWDPHGPATPEGVAEETLAALATAEEQGHSIGLELRDLVDVLTREQITPPIGLEGLAGADIILAEGEVVESTTEKIGEISPVSAYMRQTARVRVGSVVYHITRSWASGSGVGDEDEIVREDL